MNFKLCCFILIFCLFINGMASDSDVPADSSRIYDSWFSPDKGRHVLGSMMTTVLISKIGQNELNMQTGNAQLTAVGFSLSIGLGKELIDSSRPDNRFSWKDLAADVVGIAIGLVIAGIK